MFVVCVCAVRICCLAVKHTAGIGTAPTTLMTCSPQVNYLGATLNVSYDSTHITLTQTGGKPLLVNSERALKTGKPLALPLAPLYLQGIAPR